MGFDSVLLVTGENERLAGMEYFQEIIPAIRDQLSYLAIEIQPLDLQGYSKMDAMGVDAVMVYQETYHQPTYEQCHLRGQKTDYIYRLNTADRAAQAGMDKIGLGTLLGLSQDWRTDSAFAAAHPQPGGYADPEQRLLEQFAIDDNRSADDVARAINDAGLEPVWTDWNRVYSGG
ncbi:hypothetical protein M3P05_07940 [Sansalvadorimonas sp. 2012CJ34-2]|uniref:Uncharacterized protein n=1 Tax=Parendozoicomonas callyspongiae TaxID=2942213 RepID=A0ABT0PF31_9GAMM|nr:hypothetical protein [Sansalvadorimonas sp. 2012CJ34-2]MCL6269871.1 hypothetical protein [Sansalvadorimonas sp. 2012CJ34-2]